MLSSPLHEDGQVVLVASRGGAPRHPAWFLNLRDNPRVELTMRGRTRPMTARVATKSERDRLWPRIVRAYPGYALYQLRTSRQIPVVILEPEASA
jgi:deazaflavin-dependent oxidoreductase (nitroreductase family)